MAGLIGESENGHIFCSLELAGLHARR